MLSPESIVRMVNRQLQREEGYRQYCYDDATGQEVFAPKGNLTIGIGFNLSAGCPLDLAEIIATYFVKKADAQLSKDLDFYEKLSDVRKCVFIDMAFNMGVEGAEAFHDTLNLTGQGFYSNAAAQLRKSLWYKQVPHRAEPLCVELETNQWMPGV